jgi:hypothetical protein
VELVIMVSYSPPLPNPNLNPIFRWLSDIVFDPYNIEFFPILIVFRHRCDISFEFRFFFLLILTLVFFISVNMILITKYVVTIFLSLLSLSSLF